MTGEKRTSREYLVDAMQSLAEAYTAWDAAQNIQRARGQPTDDPLSQAYSWTMDALMKGVSGFILALDEATVAKQLLEYPHTHKLFEPVIIRRELILAGQYLMAFELLMDSVVGRLRASFYTAETPSEERAQKEKDYKACVVALSKSILHASCLWLRQQGALNDDDIALIDEIRRRRNDIAHRLPALLYTPEWYVPIDQFPIIAALVGKIDIWWIKHTGATKPRSMRMVLLEYMLESVAQVDLGDDSPLRARHGTGTEPKERDEP